MIPHPQALPRDHSPTIWGLVAAAAGGLLYVAVWNIRDLHRQAKEFALRA